VRFGVIDLVLAVLAIILLVLVIRQLIYSINRQLLQGRGLNRPPALLRLSVTRIGCTDRPDRCAWNNIAPVLVSRRIRVYLPLTSK